MDDIWTEHLEVEYARLVAEHPRWAIKRRGGLWLAELTLSNERVIIGYRDAAKLAERMRVHEDRCFSGS
jgi:hypothetical protein